MSNNSSTPFLDKISSPFDLKLLSDEQLFQVASELRQETISAVSKTGANGPHTTGKAVDISVRDSQHRKQLIDYFSPQVQGLGIAKSFIHIDILFEEDGFPGRPNSWVY